MSNISSHLEINGMNESPNTSDTSNKPNSFTSTQWQPNEQTLNTIITILAQSTLPISKVQNDIYKQLEPLTRRRDFCNHLVYILACSEDQLSINITDVIRQIAALLLQSNLPLCFHQLHSSIHTYFSHAMIHSMIYRSSPVRLIISSCVSKFVSLSENNNSQEPLILTFVLHILQSYNSNTKNIDLNEIISEQKYTIELTYEIMESALMILTKLAEETPKLLEQHESKPLDKLIPTCIQLCNEYEGLEEVTAPSDTTTKTNQTDNLSLKTKQKTKIKLSCLTILNYFCLNISVSIINNLDNFMNMLFILMKDKDTPSQIQKKLCTSICILLESLPNLLSPYMDNIIEFMLITSLHSDCLIAKEACEFWSLFAHVSMNPNILKPYLPRLIPIFLHNLTLNNQNNSISTGTNNSRPSSSTASNHIQTKFKQLSIDSSDNDDPSTGLDDIHQLSNSKSITFKESEINYDGTNIDANIMNGHTNNSNTTSDGLLENSASVDQENNGQKKEEDNHSINNEKCNSQELDEDSEWTVRKCSASALDVLSCILNDEILELIMPLIQEKLHNNERWEERECGILAIGVIGEGCFEGMKKHMKVIFPYLLNCISNKNKENPIIRSISYWTISRYIKLMIYKAPSSSDSNNYNVDDDINRISASNIQNNLSNKDDKHDKHDMINDNSSNNSSNIKNETFQQFIKILLDDLSNEKSNQIQKSVCSTLAIFLEEENGIFLNSYIKPLLLSLSNAFNTYDKGSMFILYDIVCTLSEIIGSKLNHLEYINILLPLLLTKWNEISNDDVTMLPLLECLACVVRALGSNCEPFASSMFSRCSSIISGIYVKENAVQKEKHEKDNVSNNSDHDNINHGCSDDEKDDILYDDNHVDFITCCLDLCCAITEALGSSVDSFFSSGSSNSSSGSNSNKSSNVMNSNNINKNSSINSINNNNNSSSPNHSQPNLNSTSSTSPFQSSKMILTLLFVCMKDERSDIRQSAFALLGEFARARIPSMIGSLKEYFKCAMKGLNPKYMSVSNNAAWSLGELIMMIGYLSQQNLNSNLNNKNQIIMKNIHGIKEDVNEILFKGTNTNSDNCINILINIVDKKYSIMNKSLLENAALTLGRIGLIYPNELSTKLHVFSLPVFSILRNIRDDVEKEQAFYGMNSMIRCHPTAIYNSFIYYVDAVISWFHCKPELEAEFASIFNAYKLTLQDQWYILFNSLSTSSQSLLQQRFGL